MGHVLSWIVIGIILRIFSRSSTEITEGYDCGAGVLMFGETKKKREIYGNQNELFYSYKQSL
jgi:cytochrome bd-type quinol oxidase subunit 2